MTDARDPGTEGTDSTAEGAEDLDDEALAAATLGAQADVSMDVPPAYPEDEGDDEEVDDEDAGDGGAGVAATRGTDRTVSTEEGPHLRPEERRAARRAARTQIPIDPALRIKDPASVGFVVLAVAVFALIFLNGLVLGRGGILTPIPSPTAVPSEVVPSVGPSDTTAPSATTAPSDTTAPSPTIAPASASPAAS